MFFKKQVFCLFAFIDSFLTVCWLCIGIFFCLFAFIDSFKFRCWLGVGSKSSAKLRFVDVFHSSNETKFVFHSKSGLAELPRCNFF